MAAVLEVKNLTKVYPRKGHKDGLTAVNDVSFRVNEGEIVGFIGPNGAGKTTTIKMIAGLARPTAGEVFICGHSVTRDRVNAMKHVGGVTETPDMYPDMSGLKNLNYLVSLHPKETMLDPSDERFSTVSKKSWTRRGWRMCSRWSGFGTEGARPGEEVLFGHEAKAGHSAGAS